jgi:hypothetical protein
MWTPRRQRQVGASRGSARAPTSPQEGRAIAVKRPCNKALSSDSGSGKLAEDRVARERGLAARLVARSRPLRAAACDSQTTAMTGSGAAIGVGGRVRMRQPCDAARLRCGNCFCILNTRALQLPAWPHGHLPRVRPPTAALPLPALACLRASSNAQQQRTHQPGSNPTSQNLIGQAPTLLHLGVQHKPAGAGAARQPLPGLLAAPSLATACGSSSVTSCCQPRLGRRPAHRVAS